ncbi:hypothetical protein NLS1_06240 [Nocardioides sp. LS1]|nr:hypothetical protein NLS1_06240 [Nocardioides sp. LS1]
MSDQATKTPEDGREFMPEERASPSLPRAVGVATDSLTGMPKAAAVEVAPDSPMTRHWFSGSRWWEPRPGCPASALPLCGAVPCRDDVFSLVPPGYGGGGGCHWDAMAATSWAQVV